MHSTFRSSSNEQCYSDFHRSRKMSISNFELLERVGEGAFAHVYKVRRRSDGEIYALKKVQLMQLKDKEREMALNEVRLLASISHPNVIAYKEAFVDTASNSLCIVMEFADAGDLLSKVNGHKRRGTSFPEAEIWATFMQILQGLKTLHDARILHRDLKGANVFLRRDGGIKIGDLNVAKVAKHGFVYTQTGTPYYASPEVWRDQPYDSRSDIWSLGCIIYEMAALNPPFRSTDMEELYRKVIRGIYPSVPTGYSSDLTNVIRAMLQVNPAYRPTCDKLMAMPLVAKHVLPESGAAHPAELLETIKVPRSLHRIGEALPKANYTSRRPRNQSAHPEPARPDSSRRQRSLSRENLPAPRKLSARRDDAPRRVPLAPVSQNRI